ncbi:MAG: hydrolase 2, exosortase A system-associated [Methylococcales bacterium]|nr:hydrolase 2, exosortase A system-associated [Methylococcales bacterium]
MANEPANIPLVPQFITGTKGPLFCLSFLPEDKSSEILLFLPAFAEELNRCRVMVAMQARELAAIGVGSLLLDFYGTGDSAGEFEETNWTQWQQDARTAIDWLNAQGYHSISLWGMRLGALLAAEIANSSPIPFTRLVLWQPILSGDKYLTQFLRIRLAFLMEHDGDPETTQQIRSALHQGSVVEIGGYELSPQLADDLDAKSLHTLTNLAGLEIHWFEWVFGEDAQLPPGSQKVIAGWQQAGIDPLVHPYTGPSFWQAHERELTPQLINLTTSLFA